MKKVENNEVDLGGEFMIQDHDHMVQAGSTKSGRGNARQADQSQTGGRQQGDDHGSNPQQGGDRSRQRR